MGVHPLQATVFLAAIFFDDLLKRLSCDDHYAHFWTVSLDSEVDASKLRIIKIATILPLS